MKLYQVIRLERKLTKELSELKNRFMSNNCININEVREYEPNDILEEIKKKQEKLLRIRFLIQRHNLSIYHLILQNIEFESIVNMLKTTPTSMDNNKVNAFLRSELDKTIQEYRDKIENNNLTIDSFNYTTDVEV